MSSAPDCKEASAAKLCLAFQNLLHSNQTGEDRVLLFLAFMATIILGCIVMPQPPGAWDDEDNPW